MDVLGGDFTSPAVLGGTNGATQVSVSVETLNGACLALGAEPYEAASFEVRVKSTASGFEPMYSDKITIVVNPYTTATPKVYAIGNFLNASGYGSDWSPAATLPALASSGFGETDFEGYVYMNVATPEFKILPTNTSFDGDYGDDGTFSGALAQEGESNILLSAPGYYRVQANTTSLAYSTTLTTWGIVGFATTGDDSGWNNSIPLTYNSTTKKWEGTVTLSAGNFKFRANNAWDINLGGDNDDDTFMNYGGPDISNATAGSYFVELDLSNPRAYTYSLTAN